VTHPHRHPHLPTDVQVVAAFVLSAGFDPCLINGGTINLLIRRAHD
jgi:hypothetical protein